MDNKKFPLGILFFLIISINIFGLTYGDVDSNGVVNIVDALMTAQVSVAISVPNFNAAAADVDAVNGINIVDALMIAQFHVGTLTIFPADNLQPTSTPLPGTENIINGDFSAGTTNWSAGFYDPGAGSMFASNGELYLAIDAGGTAMWNIQLTQGGLNITSGTDYTFSFDARSAASRSIEANIGMSVAPYTSYFASSALILSTTMKTYSFTFTALTSDLTARVEFNCGLDANDVYLDNISLIGSTNIATPEPMIINFPDPNLEAAIRAEINKPADSIYNTDVVTIVNINLSHKNITNIAGLEHLTGLRKLILSSNYNAFDLTPLANLTNLTELNLGANYLSNIAPLANLTNLTVLNLIINEVNDISPLANLTKLTSLQCEFNEIVDVTPLANLTALTYLDLKENHIIDLTPLENLTEVTYLNLVNNQITNITGLRNLTKMNKLVLSGFPLSDITALENMTNLNMLVLNVSTLENIAPLANLTNLVSLNLDNNQIRDINLLANLSSKLKTLFLINNPLNQSSQAVINSLLATGTRVVW